MARFARHIALAAIAMIGLCTLQAQMLPVLSEKKWGLIDDEGRIILKPQFDAVVDITQGQAVVVANSKYGLLDSTGTMLVNPAYTFLQRQTSEVVRTNQGGDCEGQDCQGGKWGLINHKLDKSLPATYSLIRPFGNFGLAMANQGGKCGYDTCDGGKWGLVNLRAEEVLPTRYLRLRVWNETEVAIEDEKGWGLYHLKDQRILIRCQYNDLKRLGPGRVGMRMGKAWGILKDNGDTIAPPIYDDVADIGYGWLAYKRNDFWGIIDSFGRERGTAHFHRIRAEENGWFSFFNDNHLGLADTNGRDLTRAELDQATRHEPDFAIVRRGGFGVIGYDGRELIPTKYDLCDWVADSLFFLQRGKVLRWFTRAGAPVKTIVLDSILPFTPNNVAKAQLHGQWGIINTEGTWVAPPKYDEVLIYLQAAKGRKGDADWDHFYFSENGRPSKVKRIVIMRDYDKSSVEDLLAIPSINMQGWFATPSGTWGLRELNSMRLIIPPKFRGVRIIPGADVAAVLGKIKDSEDWAWGLVHNKTGRNLTEFLFDTIVVADFALGRYARVVFHGSEKYGLLDIAGRLKSFENAAFIGPFIDGKARINLGGHLDWVTELGLDTLQRKTIWDRALFRTRTLYQTCNGGKWGYIDPAGTWVHPAEYEAALDFENGEARIKTKGKWGLINESFQLVVEARYDFIQLLHQSDASSYYLVGMDRPQYGFIDERGQLAIKPSFEEVGRFHGGLVRIRQGKLWGYADRQGQVVVQPQYTDAGEFYEGYARVRNLRAWGFIDSLGNPLTPQKYIRAGDFHEGLAWIQGEKFFGYIGNNGQVAIEPTFSGTGHFSEGMAPVKRKGAFGLIDREGHFILEPKYFRIGPFRDSLAVVQDNGDHGLINPRGEFVVKPAYKELNDFSEGLARVRQGVSYGYMDHTGQVRIPCTYANSGHFSCGRAAVFMAGRWGFIDTAGTVVVQALYTKVLPYSEGRAAVQLKGKWGFIDLSGNTTVPMIYDEVGRFDDGRAPVRLGSQWGFVNPDGTLVIPCRYDEVGFLRNGSISVRLGKKWGLINRYGAQMTPCKYDAIGTFAEGLAPVLLRRSLGVVSGKGQVLLDPTYDTVRLNGKVLMVEDDDAFGYMTLAGRWIWEPKK